MIKSKKIDLSLLHYLEEWIVNQGLSPFIPGKMGDASPKVVFNRDMNMLDKSKYIVADVNEPSHGVGMELMYAYKHEVPVICFLNVANKPLSRMVEGSPHAIILEYENEEELKAKLEKIKLQDLHLVQCDDCSEKTIHLADKCAKCED
jgi:nucleoside 2-deoxyribosyltransferase